MAEIKGPTTTAATTKQLAMSRALGAAFLSHQVEQLEKSVTRGPASGNWRDRRHPATEQATPNKRGVINQPAKRPPSNPKIVKKAAAEQLEREQTETRKPRRSNEEVRGGKDADLVVVDASVLIHAVHHVKRWCRDGREEIVIVPLEALNTLDLLKKGTSPLAQRARAASRILEAQVGTNPRIRVQRDDAFVPWDKIDFKDAPSDDERDKTISPLHLSSSPEWVRRMICCARWEVDNAATTLEFTDGKKPKVILAVLSPAAAQMASQLPAAKTSDSVAELSSPVPLPAPHTHTHKHEPRSSGILIGHWAARANIDLFEVDATPITSSPSSPQQVNVRTPDDDERGKRQTGRGRRNSNPRGNSGSPAAVRGTGLVERPPAVMQMMEMVSQPTKVVRVLARGEKLEPDP
ncbi:hypothetical protein BJ138DRAFT_837176 [Hygrophoropsis aurantiaca]|uniref:Uncharacterized protein n=1 Tax=Hygrophoropsis aurantiaca TaxID=72124 RepID=A0ACB8AFL5_9AGAM|nr:hypothetical protein BJ138DRAFT_837176 [Hygrophoropsis aurantiaca]